VIILHECDINFDLNVTKVTMYTVNHDMN